MYANASHNLCQRQKSIIYLYINNLNDSIFCIFPKFNYQFPNSGFIPNFAILCDFHAQQK